MLNLVSVFSGDGIGPEISQSVKDIYSAAKVSFFRSMAIHEVQSAMPS